MQFWSFIVSCHLFVISYLCVYIFLFTFAQHGFILYFPCVFIFFCLRLLVVTSMSLSYKNIRNVCVHTHTHTRARARGCKGGPSAPPPATTPPVVKMDLALQLTAYIYCDWTLRNASPPGGVIAGGGTEGSPLHPLARARACVCLYFFLTIHDVVKLYCILEIFLVITI